MNIEELALKLKKDLYVSDEDFIKEDIETSILFCYGEILLLNKMNNVNNICINCDTKITLYSVKDINNISESEYLVLKNKLYGSPTIMQHIRKVKIQKIKDNI